MMSRSSCRIIFVGLAGFRPAVNLRRARGAGEVEARRSNPAGPITRQQSSVSFRVETVIGGLEVPWSMVWAPDGRMFFTERPGRVRVYEDGKLQERATAYRRGC